MRRVLFAFLAVVGLVVGTPARAQTNNAYPTIPYTSIQSSDFILLEGTRFTTQIYTTLPIMADWFRANMGLPTFSCAGSTWPKSSAAGVVTCTQPDFSNLSGTIAASQLIAPGASTFGAVKSSTAPANQFATGIDTSGAVTYAQPTAANISGLYPYAVGSVGTGSNAVANTFAPASQALYLAGTYTGDGYAPYAVLSVFDTATNSAPTGIGKTGGNPLSSLFIAHNINNGAAEGNRFGLNVILTKNAAVSGTNTLKKNYTPFFAQHYLKASDGAGSSTFYGTHQAISGLIQTDPNITYLDAVQAGELDVSIQAGSTVQLKAALLLASVNSDAVNGSVFDGMLAFGADSTTTAKWKFGAAFGWPRGPWPFDTTSTLVGTVAPGSGSRVANHGVDFSAVAFAGCAFKSSNFCVSDAGAITAGGTIGASTISTTGASAGFVAGPRSGSGNSYQWYNPTGVGLKLSDGGSDLISLTSTGGIYAGAELAPASILFANLGTCNAGTRGALKVVTDGAAALAWGATQTGGASAVYLSFCNGANWTVAAK